MCGRFTLRAPAGEVARQFSLLEVPLLEPRFNIAPSQPVPVVRLVGSKGTVPFSPTTASPQCPENRDSPHAVAGRRQCVMLRWGLVPSWAGDPAIGNRLINVRAESAADKPAFRAAFRSRRCLIAADGFYEWRQAGKRRQPHFFRMCDDSPFGFAGLWESWEGPDHSAIQSCTILTTEANDLVRPIHLRMPAIVAPADYDRWLDPDITRPEPLVPLLRPYPNELMAACVVSPLVNSSATDDPRCIQPAENDQ